MQVGELPNRRGEKCKLLFFFFFRYPDKEQLQAIYGAYLTPIMNKQLGRHPVWGNPAKVYALAGSMVQLYDQVWTGFNITAHQHKFIQTINLKVFK